MIEVHHFKVWNIHTDKWEFPSSKRTAENIKKLKGEIIFGTAEKIDLSQLDEDDRFFPLTYGARQ